MTGFPSPLTTATLLLLSVAAMTTRANADFLVESDGGLAVKISTVRQGNTTPCDYCFNSGVALSPDCIAQSDIVKSIISRDSSCGRMWDPFCIVEYNDCYNEACGADQQGVIDTIAATGGPVGAPINREQIRAKCTGTDGRVDPSPPKYDPNTDFVAPVWPENTKYDPNFDWVWPDGDDPYFKAIYDERGDVYDPIQDNCFKDKYTAGKFCWCWLDLNPYGPNIFPTPATKNRRDQSWYYITEDYEEQWALDGPKKNGYCGDNCGCGW